MWRIVYSSCLQVPSFWAFFNDFLFKCTTEREEPIKSIVVNTEKAKSKWRANQGLHVCNYFGWHEPAVV